MYVDFLATAYCTGAHFPPVPLEKQKRPDQKSGRFWALTAFQVLIYCIYKSYTKDI